MNRREYIIAAATSATTLVAGCSGGPIPGSSDPDQPENPDDTAFVDPMNEYLEAWDNANQETVVSLIHPSSPQGSDLIRGIEYHGLDELNGINLTLDNVSVDIDTADVKQLDVDIVVAPDDGPAEEIQAKYEWRVTDEGEWKVWVTQSPPFSEHISWLSGNSVGYLAPNTQIAWDYNADADEVVILHDGGSSFTPDNTGLLELQGDIVEGETAAGDWGTNIDGFGGADATEGVVTGSVGAGDVIWDSAGAAANGEFGSGVTLKLVWHSPDRISSQVIGTWESP